MKKISILITSYNLVDCIDNSISSVVNQEMPCEWELLVGDDGSTDGTVERIKQWIQKYPQNIKLISIDRPRSSVKDGLRAAKNRAFLLEQISGDYIIFLDGDDCWIGTEKLKKQFEILENPENSDCSSCGHNTFMYYISSDSGYNMTKESIPSRKFTLEEYWDGLYFHTNTILFRKSCVEYMLSSLYRDYLNDNFITFLLLQKGNIYYINKSWNQYNITGNGLWTGGKPYYNHFRNLCILDLELIVNPGLKKLCMKRHRSSLIYISFKYNESFYDEISPVVSNLDANVFHYTCLLSKTSDLSANQIMEKVSLRLFYLPLRLKQLILEYLSGIKK